MHDILNGIRVVKSYGNEWREVQRYSGCSEEWAKSCTRAEIMWYLTIPISEFILTIGNFFVLYFGGRMVLGETMSLGHHTVHHLRCDAVHADTLDDTDTAKSGGRFRFGGQGL